MKHWIYRLEIMDGEHGYFSSSICKAETREAAITYAGQAAKNWYEDSDGRTKISEKGQLPAYEHQFGTIICSVDQVEEIPAEHYEILKNYNSYL